MKLYLVQHAEAKAEEEDPARPLSEKGLKDIRSVAGFLRGKNIRVSRILHSGKLRAKQTAEALSEAIPSSIGVEETGGLAPLDDPCAWEERLSAESGDVVLVSHLPLLAKLAGLLLASDPERKVVDFRMGGIVCLEKSEEGDWSIQWVLTPRILGE